METLNVTDKDKLICERYQNAINYYWNASKTNKSWYKLTRSLTVIVGALVTLVASMASSKVIVKNSWVDLVFTIGTPVLAATLTVIAGFSQSFQWGSTWQNMVITAEQLQKEFDIYMVTPEDKRDYAKEAEKLNQYLITESTGFFERMLGSAKTSTKTD